MKTMTDLSALEALYDTASPASLDKVARRITPLYRQWIEASRFMMLSTVGPEGTDCSPRGDDGPVVRIMDEKTVMMPDWRGNNRLDSLRNIVQDGRVSLMFMVPGCKNVVRVNGHGVLTADETITGQFDKGGKRPKTVIVITVGEAYFQCSKAIMRSGLWDAGNESGAVPTAGQFLKEMKEGFDAVAYDEGYPSYAKEKMW